MFRIFQVRASGNSLRSRLHGGEGGIRTLGTGVSPYNGLANRRIRPLCHLSRVPSFSAELQFTTGADGDGSATKSGFAGPLETAWGLWRLALFTDGPPPIPAG